jgi:hypothetical protein
VDNNGRQEGGVVCYMSNFASCNISPGALCASTYFRTADTANYWVSRNNCIDVLQKFAFWACRFCAVVWAGSRKDPKQVPLFRGREIRAANFTLSILA